MKSFLAALKAAVSTMWKKAPAVFVAIASAINNLVPIVERLDIIIVPEYAGLLNPILDKVKVGLSALKATIQAAGDKENITSIVDAVQGHLSELVSAAQVKNPQLALQIKEVTDIVAGELAEIHAHATA